jgi:DNA-binding MarR family transcriptional regulator
MSHAEPTDLPMEFEDKAHEALVSTWWTGTLLKKAFRRFFRKAVGSEAQFNVLMVLQAAEEAGEDLNQNDLSNRLMIDKSNVTGLIDRMEDQDLVRRNTVPGDRRSYHITLTPQGRELVQQVQGPYIEKVHQAMSEFTADEQEELTRLTSKLRERLTELI